jgi:soluble lytic murein transglycosylase
MAAARSNDIGSLRLIYASASDPAVRSYALWELTEVSPEALSFSELDGARQRLIGWPHMIRREVETERLLQRSGLAPNAVITWFHGSSPRTIQGSMALAEAYLALGDRARAHEVLAKAWRETPFSADLQQSVLARHGDLLTAADNAARADLLLYGEQDRAAMDMVALLPPSEQAVARARQALRVGSPDAEALVAALPPQDQLAPGLVFERVARLRDAERFDEALALARFLPRSVPNEEAAEKLWRHGRLVLAGLQAGDYRNAYEVAARSAPAAGEAAAEANFYAGWIALSKLHDPALAEPHFERLHNAGQSPLTQARAYYWQGRTAEAAGDVLGAQILYGQAAHFVTTFYGQLAAARAGITTLDIGRDPATPPDVRARFESLDQIRVARWLRLAGSADQWRRFVLGLSEDLPSPAEAALLVDMVRDQGETFLAMKVVRNEARRGIVLPERGYPVVTPPEVPGAPEPSLVLGIIRQESSFDPHARSGPGARGMMQLMPSTAAIVARRSGLGSGNLDDPDYNMRVGSVFLGQLVDQFSGSYVLAAAAYNAGPGRPAAWVTTCGDPRKADSDPLDFIECIPFHETRDYVMRVLEASEVYRARLSGGMTPNRLAQDLKRGGFQMMVGAK